MIVVIRSPLTTVSLLTLFVLQLLSIRASATSAIVYKEYFHSKSVDSAMAPWRLQQSTPRITRSPRGINHLGLFKSNDTLFLFLRNLPRHQRITVEFGFHIIGSWNGVTDNDRFIFLADGQPIIDESFSNTTSSQSWPATQPGVLYPPRATARNSNMLAYPGRVADVYVGPMDATYATVEHIDHIKSDFTVAITSSLNNIVKGKEFKGWGLEYFIVYADDTSASAVEEDDQPSVSSDGSSIQTFTGRDIRSLAEFSQDGDFPGLKVGSDFERALHIVVAGCECHSCGDFCLWYTFRVYTDGWVNVWSNKPAKGESLVSVQLNIQELDTIRTLISECLEYGLDKEYHDASFEESHPDLTHCTLSLKLGRHEAQTEVYASEPITVRSLMYYMLDVLSRHGWVPSPG
ncbi:MAG: hypothetical protein HYX66_09560 [Ignavibacteria bacterium]|nr:hypothetical protein [Ignavibacteria bacterium]